MMEQMASGDEGADGSIPDGPTWTAIGIFALVVVLAAGLGAGLGFLWGAEGMIWVGAILGGFMGGTFGAAGIGWSYRNMDWIPMTYEERTLLLVMGILFLASPLALHLLHPGH